MGFSVCSHRILVGNEDVGFILCFYYHLLHIDL